MAVAATKQYGRTDQVAPSNPPGSDIIQSLYRQFNITTAFSSSNTLDIGYLPKGAVCIGGYFAAVDLDTGTETLDIDIGIAANGVDSADPDFFANSGVLSGDAIATDLPLTNAANLRLFTGRSR